jgi:hypothetical protein
MPVSYERNIFAKPINEACADNEYFIISKKLYAGYSERFSPSYSRPPLESRCSASLSHSTYFPTPFSVFTLNGTLAESGTVNCVVGCDVSAVPLPAALPLFGSGVIALAGLAW